MAIPPIGQIPRRALIAGVTLSPQCQVTTVDPHEYITGDFVRITDLDSCMPVLRGMDQINNGLFEIEVNGINTFLLKDPITHIFIDSTLFTPYVQGGRCNLDNHTYIFHPPPP